ncbi:hypothetical protein DSM106044_03445 [Robinsoniella peoriensis]|uniref:Uncharacterized protein n=1 Tax=Robinsoniella peoriensis TaxID=180332 RepID=A0A4U8Q5S4_9FIRM|nr:hypothetical protein DSM106044_03445 [Robinsoniella peoriensis]
MELNFMIFIIGKILTTSLYILGILALIKYLRNK